MEQSINSIFDIKYENNSTSNYLVLRPITDKKIINYQTQMLLNNRIKGILDFNINYIENNCNCFYDITSKCNLASFLARKRFSRDEFLITLLMIVNNIYNLKSYLLYDNNILLDEKYIYMEPDSLTVFFLYLPFTECKNDLKVFFFNLVIRLVKFQDEDSDNYIQKILEHIKSERFNLSNLKQLLETLLGNAIKEQPSTCENTEEKKIGKQKLEKLKVDKGGTVLDFDNARNKKNHTGKGIVRIPQNQNERKIANGFKDKGEKTSAVQTKGFNLLFLLLIQPLLLIIFILIVNSSLISESGNPKSTIGILLFIFIAIDVLVIKTMIEKNKIGFSKSSKSIDYIISKMKKTEESIEESYLTRNNLIENKKNISGETEIIKTKKSEGTPYLKEKDCQEIIKIDKESLLLGRMDNFVDYVINNNAIGKIHAEIIKENGQYYVMDCNTKNGTFINGMRIVPNTKNKLHNNDEVRFANKEYEFVEE